MSWRVRVGDVSEPDYENSACLVMLAVLVFIRKILI